jgi:hypothetical protein
MQPCSFLGTEGSGLVGSSVGVDVSLPFGPFSLSAPAVVVACGQPTAGFGLLTPSAGCPSPVGNPATPFVLR